MKVKGINPLEQNVEKIVLGVSGAALLGVVAMQLLGGSTVEVGTEKRPLEQAYQPVRDEANRVLAQMNDADPQLPDVPVVDLMGQYTQQATRPVAATPRIVALGPPTAISGAASAEDAAPILDAVYAAVRVPAPAAPTGYAFRSTIDPTQVARSPEIAALVPVSQPHDKSAITIETTFNGRALAEGLRTDPDGAAGPQRPLPLRWWQDALEIVAVRTERQTLQPNGQWSNPEPVRPLPGTLDLLKPQGVTPPGAVPAGGTPAQGAEERYNPVTLRSAVSQARQMSTEILRPQYLNVIAGRPWMPPSANEGVAAIEARREDIDRLRNQRREIEQEILRAQMLLEREGEDDGGGRNEPPASGPEARRDNREQNQRNTNNRQPEEDPAIVALRGRITRFEEQLVANEEALKAIGVGLNGQPLDTWSEEANTLDYNLPTLESEEVRIWAHDVHVEPGATYRYRTQVVFNNPFFGNGPALLPDQQSLAAEPFVHSEWSPWGAPVSVEQNFYYFVTAASTGDNLNATPRAQVEVFQFYYGYWRRGTANLSAGDLIVASMELPDPELRPIFDLTKPPAAPGAPGGQPGGNRPGGPQVDPNEGVNPDDIRRREAEERQRARQPGGPGGGPGMPPRPPGMGPGGPRINALAVPGPEELPVAVTDAVLLDVTTLPGGQEIGLAGVGARQVFQAVLKTGSGRIEVRSPDRDRSTDLYRRLRVSAEDGLRQGQPEVEPEVEVPEIPILPPEREQRGPAPAPGGGGGGGGGG